MTELTRGALLLYILIVNLAALVLYAADKRRAVRGMWRVPEATLLTVAAVGGSLGALLGMHLCRHKTKHLKFTLLVPAFFVLHAAIFSYLFWIIS